MKLSRLYQKYLRGSDLQGREHQVTIKEMDIVEVIPRINEPPQKKWCLIVTGFQDTQLDGLGILMGTKMVAALEEIFGAIDHTEYPGKQIVIFPKSLKVAGQDRIAIRFKRVAADRNNGRQPAPRVARGKQSSEPPPPDDDDPIPF